MKDHKHKVGKWGEDLGADYLDKIGYKILDRNYRTPAGEIDLIALHDIEGEICLVFVEVKTRTNERFGYPEQSITRKKWQHILLSIDYYLENHQRYDYDWRIDVIAIQCLSPDYIPDLKHFENVVIPNGEDY